MLQTSFGQRSYQNYQLLHCVPLLDQSLIRLVSFYLDLLQQQLPSVQLMDEQIEPVPAKKSQIHQQVHELKDRYLKSFPQLILSVFLLH